MKTHFTGSRSAVDLGFYHDPGINGTGYSLGDVWFVDSVHGTDAAGNGRSPDSPFASLAYALTLVTANNGDVCHLVAGHVEVIAAATTLALSVAGLRIIGHGVGSNRPQFLFNGTASLIAISAANVTLSNVYLAAGIDEVVTAISVTAANVTLDRVDVVETSAKQFIQFCLTNAAADDLTIQGCKHHQATTAPAAASLWIQLVGADRAKIVNNWIQIKTTDSSSSNVIESDATAPKDILIQNNVIVQLGGVNTVPIKLVAATTGFIIGTQVASQKTNIVGSISCASCFSSGCTAGHIVNTSGITEPAADTN